MINVVKVTFTMAPDLKAKLASLVEAGKQSAFVSTAIREKIEQLEKAKLHQELLEQYEATSEESLQEIKPWQAASLNVWVD